MNGFDDRKEQVHRTRRTFFRRIDEGNTPRGYLSWLHANITPDMFDEIFDICGWRESTILGREENVGENVARRIRVYLRKVCNEGKIVSVEKLETAIVENFISLVDKKIKISVNLSSL